MMMPLRMLKLRVGKGRQVINRVGWRGAEYYTLYVQLLQSAEYVLRWPRGTLANCVLHQIASAFCVPASAFCVHGLIGFYVLRSRLDRFPRSAFAV